MYFEDLITYDIKNPNPIWRGNMFIDYINNYTPPVEEPERKWYEKKKPPVEKKLDLVEEITENWEMDLLIQFEVLFKFCQFIRYAEKLMYYDNIVDGMIYVDTELDSEDLHQAIVNFDEVNCKLLIKLEKKVVNDVKMIRVLKLKLMHTNGKKLTNEYTIVDNFVKYTDSSDEMLLNNIYVLLKKRIVTILKNTANRKYLLLSKS